MVCWGLTGRVPRWAALTLLVPGEAGSQMSVQQRLWLCSRAQRQLLPWWGPWRHRRGIERAAPALLRAGTAWGESPEPLGDLQRQNRDRRTCLSELCAPSCCWGPGGEQGESLPRQRGVCVQPRWAVTQLARKRSQARTSPGPAVLLLPVDSRPGRLVALPPPHGRPHLSCLPRAGGPGPYWTGRTPGSQRLATCPGVTRGLRGSCQPCPGHHLTLHQVPPRCRVRPLPVTGSGSQQGWWGRKLGPVSVD